MAAHRHGCCRPRRHSRFVRVIVAHGHRRSPRPARRHLDARLRRTGHAGASTTRSASSRSVRARRQERSGPGTGDLGRERLLRAPGQVDPGQDSPAGRCGRWSGGRTCSRTNQSSTCSSRGKATSDPALRLLPRVPQGPDLSHAFPDDPQLECRVRHQLGDECGRPGPAHGDRGGQEAGRQGRPRWPLARWRGGHRLCHVGLRREAGADHWPGLVYIDGASSPAPEALSPAPRPLP